METQEARWYQENKTRISAKQRKYYLENREEIIKKLVSL